MEKIKIELTKEFRGGEKNTSFAGRVEGKGVREKLKLDTKDKNGNNYDITMPEDTTSFNPSFYLGLFYDSIKTLGWDNFIKKYTIDYSNMSDDLADVIKQNIAECERKAKNEIDGFNSIHSPIYC